MQNINHHPSRMNMVIIAKQLHWIIPTTLIVNTLNLLIADWLFLSLTADVQEVLKLMLTLVSLVLTGLDTKSLSSANTGKQRALIFASDTDDKIGISFDPVASLTYPENRMYISASGSYIIQ